MAITPLPLLIAIFAFHYADLIFCHADASAIDTRALLAASRLFAILILPAPRFSLCRLAATLRYAASASH